MWIYIDLDGTILDVFERYSGIFNLYAGRMGKCITKEEYKQLRQSGFTDYDILERKWNIRADRTEYKKLKHKYLESREWLEKDTVIGNSEKLREYECKFAIITQRNNKEEALHQIKRLKLDSFFDDIVVLKPCCGRNSKFEYLKGRAGKEDCIIGDSFVELECSRRLGIRGYFVKTGLFGTEIVKNEKIGKDYIECIESIISENKMKKT